MAYQRMIQAVETHSGEPMRVITGGVPHIPGDSVYEQMRWLEKNDDQLRRLMLREPRGYPPLCCNLIVPPKHPDAAARLAPDDILVDSMRGRSSTWTRIRVNLRNVPEEIRPPQETPDPDDDPTRAWREWMKKAKENPATGADDDA